jgi:hypothetical protein
MTEPDMDNPNLNVTSDKVVMQNFGCLYTMDRAPVMAAASRTLIPVKNCGLSRDDQIYGVDFGIAVPSTAYFVDLASGRRALNWISVEGIPARGDVVVTPHLLPIRPSTALPVFPGVPQPGGTQLRNSGSVREFDFSVPDINLWSAAPGIDRSGNVWFLMAWSSASVPLSLALAGVTRAGIVIPPKVVVPGTVPMDAGSFGDFFDGVQDPVDGTVWFVGHYGAPKPRDSFCASRVVHVLSN